MFFHRLFRFLFATAILVGAITVVTSLLEIGQPFGGFLPAWRPPDKWMIDNGTPPWWEGLTQGGLTYQDRLLTLDGAPFDANYTEVFAQASRNQQATLPITVQRGNATIALNVPVVRYRFAHLLEVKFAEWLSGFAVLLIGFLIYRVRPNDALNRAAALACGVFSINQWMWHFSLLGGQISWLWLLDIVWLLATPFLGPALLSFALRFLRQDAPLPRSQVWLIAVSYLIAGILAISHTLVRSFVLPIDYALLQTLRDVLYRLVILDIFGGAIAFLLVLLMGLSLQLRDDDYESTTRMRQQRAMLAIGFLIALPALARHLYVLLTDAGSFYIANGLDLRYLYLGIPLTMSLAIVRYQTFKSEVPLLLSIAATISAAILASVGDWLFRLYWLPSGQAFLLPPFLVFFLLLFAAFSGFQWLSHRSMPRIFRWQSTSYSAVKRFGSRLTGQTDLARLPQQITQTLLDELQLEQAALWLNSNWNAPPHNNGATLGPYWLAAIAPSNPALQWPTHAFAQWPSAEQLRLNQPFRLESSANGYEAAAWLNTASAQHGPVMGLLMLGKRRDEEIFHEQDFEIIELIAQQASLFLATAHQLHELRQVPQRVAEAQESERFRIAQELHDTVQQFLGRLPFQLEVSRDLLHSDPYTVDGRLRQTVEDVQQAARTVREIRADLAPAQLQLGFVQAVRELAARFAARTGIQVETDIAADLDTLLPLTQRHAIYRVIQQALDNIEAHAHAQHVHLIANHNENHIQFTIEDDGRGFDPTQIASHPNDGHSHFGLPSMQARLTTLGGTLTIQSSPGHGTRIEGRL